jgi:hypothetical protein
MHDDCFLCDIAVNVLTVTCSISNGSLTCKDWLNEINEIWNMKYSLFVGIFPDCLKISVVAPLYRKGYKTNMSNYRPVSLLTTFSKVLEKVMHNRLSLFVFCCIVLYLLYSGRSSYRWEISSQTMDTECVKMLHPLLEQMRNIKCSWHYHYTNQAVMQKNSSNVQ